MAQMTESSIDLDWHALSEQEIRQFDEQGYLIVRDVLDQAEGDHDWLWLSLGYAAGLSKPGACLYG